MTTVTATTPLFTSTPCFYHHRYRFHTTIHRARRESVHTRILTNEHSNFASPNKSPRVEIRYPHRFHISHLQYQSTSYEMLLLSTLILALVPSSMAFDFNVVSTNLQQCGAVDITWSGGSPPFNLIVIVRDFNLFLRVVAAECLD